MRKVLIRKSDTEKLPCEVTDEQLATLIATHGAGNVLDPETNEPVKLGEAAAMPPAPAPAKPAAKRKPASKKTKKAAKKKGNR
jgi:hypothetical protein